MNQETRQETVERLREMALRMRRNLIKMTLLSGVNGAHIGGALSSADIMATLYGEVMHCGPKASSDPDRDHFILSKGHSAMLQYAVLYEAGYLSEEELFSFEKSGGAFPAHSVLNDEKGIEISSGSLGLGLGFGIGLSIAAQKRGSSSRSYVLLGNGECNEGSVWEAAMLAPQLRLDNLVAIVDQNRLQLDGESEQIVSQKGLSDSFSSFGWNVYMVDGHDFSQLLEAFSQIPLNGAPSVIIANTVKGKGVSFMENHPEFHHTGLTQEQFDLAMEELK